MINRIQAVVSILFIFISVQAGAKLPDNPADWVCSSEPEDLAQQTKTWCDAHTPSSEDLAWRKNIGFVLEPGELTDLDKKNAFDFALREFLRNRVYDGQLNWAHDLNWRMTGPYVGEFGSQGLSYGVHPAVRVYYSPEMVTWMCSDRSTELPNGAMIIKEMANINQDLGIEKPNDCMRIPDDEARMPSSWTVMFRTDVTHDRWYWANPTMKGKGNPPVLDQSAFTDESAVPKSPVQRNVDWYPTGYVFSDSSKVNTVVYPYNLYGAACINCHATAASNLTFSSLDNIVSEGLRYKWYPAAKTTQQPANLRTSLHSQVLDDISSNQKQSAAKPAVFSEPLEKINPAFEKHFGTLGIDSFDQAWKLRFPAETFDHNLSALNDLDQFLTSDQCINCHDATYANSAAANSSCTALSLAT